MLGLRMIQLLVATSFPSLLLAAVTALPTIRPERTPHPPVIDGKLDDEVWTSASPANAFVQKFPDEGRLPSEPTRVRVLYDDDALYVAVDCEQRTAPVVPRLTRRDHEVDAD